MPECRHARGKRYPLKTVLALAVAARLAGYRGVTAFSQFAGLLGQDQLKAVGAFRSERKQRYTAPSITTFHNILAACPPRRWTMPSASGTGQHSTARAPVAMDGKDLRGASKQTEAGRRMMVAAVEHGSGLVLGQKEIEDKTNEIPVVRELSSGLDLAGRAVTLDAMHAQHETARCLLEHHADYVVTAIKDNQPTMRSTTSERSTGATRPGTKPSKRPMAGSSAAAARQSTSPAPPGTAAPTSTDAARRCASNANANASRTARAAPR